jgi:16S rRNA (adenine1518-N6/adenine1519-N6)-dimethyltransferase
MHNIPSLLKRYNIHPKKSLGQNFLVDSGALHKIIVAANITPSDRVLEIGAGLGNLTESLSAKAEFVVAVELDDRLLKPLQETLSGKTNVRVVPGDMLKLDPEELMNGSGYLVVANIPYYITSALIRHLLETSCKPVRLVLTVQSEVASRICATPNDMNLLALSVQVYGEPVIVGKIPAEAFYPSPNVDSAIVRVDLYSEPVIPMEQLDVFFHLAKAGFSQKRKTLRNSISAGMRLGTENTLLLLHAASIDPMRRAETLGLEDWHRLVDAYFSLTMQDHA